MRVVVGFLVAVVVTTVLAVAAQTQMVLAGLQALGAPIPLGVRLDATLHDLVELGPAFGSVLLFAQALGLPLGLATKRLVGRLTPVAYPLGGALGVAAMLVLLPQLIGVNPVAGADGPVGFTLQCLAGAAGGWAFALVASPRHGP